MTNNSTRIIKLKNTDMDSQLGIRIATITYIDTVGNESASATASLPASKATPTAISERVNSALLVDCTSVAESKSTAFGALASTVIVKL
jgi:hypothetical protein